MRGTAKRWAALGWERWTGCSAAVVRWVRRTVRGAAVPKRVRRTVRGAAAPKRMRRTVRGAAVPRQVRRAACSVAALMRVRRIVCCTVILALCLLLCGDMVLPRQGLCLPELCVVEQQLRVLTAGAPDGWRYSLRVSPGPGGEALIADAARRDASGAWETIHTLWRPENGTWRMVRQTRRIHHPPPGVGAEDE